MDHGFLVVLSAASPIKLHQVGRDPLYQPVKNQLRPDKKATVASLNKVELQL